MSVFNYGDDFAVPDEVIPACGSRRTAAYDPRPAQQITLHRTYGRKTSSRSDFETGELIIHCGDRAPSLSELKYEAAAHRKLGALSRVVIFIEPDIYRELYHFFRVKGFDRDIAREDANSRDFCVTKSYAKTEKLTSDASTAEQKLREAKASVRKSPEPVAVTGDSFRPAVRQ